LDSLRQDLRYAVRMLLKARGVTAAAARVAVVDETMARRYWGGRDAVGSRVRLMDGWYTVVGVARAMKHRQLAETPGPNLFLPVLQAYTAQATFLVRTGGDVDALAAPVTARLREVDATLPTFNVVRLVDHVEAAQFQQRMAGSLLAGFGALALLLAAVGLYGVLAFAVGQRTREIGIRMALGGRMRDIFVLVARYGVGLTATGVGLGLAGSAAVTRLLKSLLVGVSPTDPGTFAGVAAILLAVGALACVLPARRAAAVDPVVALRYE
jgi:hypothetical protein